MRYLRAILTTFAVAAWALFTVVWLGPAALPFELPPFAVLLPLAALLSGLRFAVGDRPTRGHPVPEESPPTSGEVAEARAAFDTVSRRYFGDDRGPLERLAERMIDPARGVARISISAAFLRTHLHMAQSRTMDLSRSGDFLPVLKLTKGTLSDERQVHTAGTPLMTLSRIESHGCALAVLDLVAAAVVPRDERSGCDGYAAVRAYVDQLVIADGGVSSAEADVATKVVLSALMSAAPTPADEMRVAPLIHLVDLMVRRHVVVAILPPDYGAPPRRTIVTEYRTPNRGVVSQWRERARFLLGLEPRDFVLELAEALETPSLHVHCKAPEGMYAYAANPAVYFDPEVDSLTGRGPTESQIVQIQALDISEPRVAGTLGFDYVHGYFPDLNRLPSQVNAIDPSLTRRVKPVLQISFRERPPGITPLVFFASFLLGGAALLTLANFQGIFNSANGPSVALLYGLPFLFVGWLVSRIDTALLHHISIPTALGMLWFVLDAAALVGLVAAYAITPPDAYTWWSVLTVSCVANFYHTAFLYVVKHLRHMRKVKGSSDTQSSAE